MNQTHVKLWNLIQSQRVTAVISIAAELGIAEFLRGGPRSIVELAELTKADKRSLGRLLTALSTIGVCSPAEDDRYALTELGAGLDGDAAQSLKQFAIFEGKMVAKSWTGMIDTILTGKTAAQLLGVENGFDLMARDPEQVRIFNAAMADVSRIIAPELLQAYNFDSTVHLMDVGGGSGELIGAVAKRYPHIRGTIFDLSRCADSALSHLKRIGVDDRIKFVAGDFFQTIPPLADAIMMKCIIHDWSDELSLTILGNCRKALPEAGKLLLIERLMPELPGVSDQHREKALSDLNMLRGPGGRERTERQYAQLLGEAGFVHSATFPAGRFDVIEARVA